MATALAAILEERQAWKAAGRAVVFTNGCFDLLHPGHVALLEARARPGRPSRGRPQQRRSVRALKGAGRPLVPESRARGGACGARGRRPRGGLRRGHAPGRDRGPRARRAGQGRGLGAGRDRRPRGSGSGRTGAWCASSCCRAAPRRRWWRASATVSAPSLPAIPAGGLAAAWIGGRRASPDRGSAPDPGRGRPRRHPSGLAGPARLLVPLLVSGPPAAGRGPHGAPGRARGGRPAHAGPGERARRARCSPPRARPGTVPRPAAPSGGRAAARGGPARGHARAAARPRRLAGRPPAARPRPAPVRDARRRDRERRGAHAGDPARGARRGRLSPRGSRRRARPGRAPRRHPRRLPARPGDAGAHRVPRRHRREPAHVRPRDPAHHRHPRPPRGAAPLRRVRAALRARRPAPNAAGALRGRARAARAAGEDRARPGRRGDRGAPAAGPGRHRAALGGLAGMDRRPSSIRRRSRRRRTLPRARARGARAPRGSPGPGREEVAPPGVRARGADPARPRHPPARGGPRRARPPPALPPAAALRGRPPRPGRATSARREGPTVLFLGTPGRAERLQDVLREDGLSVGRRHRRRRARGRPVAGFELPDPPLRVLADGDVLPGGGPPPPRAAARGRAQLPLRLPRPQGRRPRRAPGPRHRPLRGPGDARGRGHCAASSWSSSTRAATSSRCRSRASTASRSTRARKGRAPVVDKLGSGTWEKIKRRVKKAMRDMAAELLKLYAERKARPGHAFTGREPLAARVRGDASSTRRRPTRRRPSPTSCSDMSDDVAHGPPHLRRRGLRQDRGRHARGHAGGARRQAGGGARPHHRPGLPALEDVPQALRARSRCGWRWSRASARPRRSRPVLDGRARRARWTSSSAPTACSPRTWPSATSACS